MARMLTWPALCRKGHYGRALEEAMQTQKSQWPAKWTTNPLSGGRSFNTMAAEERVSRLLPSRPLYADRRSR